MEMILLAFILLLPALLVAVEDLFSLVWNKIKGEKVLGHVLAYLARLISGIFPART
jgi:hypothetical protein